MSLPSKYQAVVTATDYALTAEDGTPFPYFLRFDGSDDSMSTNAIDFSATDKMSVFAGVRKLSDAAQGVVAELSATIASNNGTFLLSAPNSAAGNYNFSSKGTVQADNTVINNAAPITNILTGLASIAADVNTFSVNATPTVVSTDQGTGNFGNYPIYIGSRNNASVRFNGRIYSLIIRGALTQTPLLEQTENWVEAKTFGKDMSYVYSDEVTTAAGEMVTTADGQQIYTTVTYQ